LVIYVEQQFSDKPGQCHDLLFLITEHFVWSMFTILLAESGTVPLLEVINPVSSTDVTRLITEMDCEVSAVVYRVIRLFGNIRGFKLHFCVKVASMDLNLVDWVGEDITHVMGNW
jgi:hypothetical protein